MSETRDPKERAAEAVEEIEEDLERHLKVRCETLPGHLSIPLHARVETPGETGIPSVGRQVSIPPGGGCEPHVAASNQRVVA